MEAQTMTRSSANNMAVNTHHDNGDVTASSNATACDKVISKKAASNSSKVEQQQQPQQQSGGGGNTSTIGITGVMLCAYASFLRENCDLSIKLRVIEHKAIAGRLKAECDRMTVKSCLTGKNVKLLIPRFSHHATMRSFSFYGSQLIGVKDNKYELELTENFLANVVREVADNRYSTRSSMSMIIFPQLYVSYVFMLCSKIIEHLEATKEHDSITTIECHSKEIVYGEHALDDIIADLKSIDDRYKIKRPSIIKEKLNALVIRNDTNLKYLIYFIFTQLYKSTTVASNVASSGGGVAGGGRNKAEDKKKCSTIKPKRRSSQYRHTQQGDNEITAVAKKQVTSEDEQESSSGEEDTTALTTSTQQQQSKTEEDNHDRHTHQSSVTDGEYEYEDTNNIDMDEDDVEEEDDEEEEDDDTVIIVKNTMSNNKTTLSQSQRKATVTSASVKQPTLSSTASTKNTTAKQATVATTKREKRKLVPDIDVVATSTQPMAKRTRTNRGDN